jgi:hypothetical protein
MTSVTRISEELAARIDADRRHHENVLPERTVIAWRAYLAGLFEWGVLDQPSYDRLLRGLPDLADDPAVHILRGRDDD